MEVLGKFDISEKREQCSPKPRDEECCPAQRLELLKKIKKKVRSGYYNSDNVLEDLSHAFAKAVDSSL